MPKRLYRSRTDRMLFGVAGGFAEYLDMDPAFVRIIWALLILAGGAGLLLYIVAAIVIPEAPYGYASAGPGAPAADPASATGATGATGDAQATTSAPGQSAWATDRPRPHRDGNGALVLGGLLVIVGGWFIVRDLLPNFDDRFVGPAFLIVVGVVLVLGALRRS